MVNNKQAVEDVVIIGGGPAGLAAATYLARANLNPLVFTGSPPGGQLMLTSDVENFPGFPSILGSELIQKMREQAQKCGGRLVDVNVEAVDLNQRPFMLKLATPVPTLLPDRAIRDTIITKSIIIAAGAKALWLRLESETKLRGKGVSACATCDGFFFRNKTVAVVGGGDTALEEASTLAKFANKVYIIHRRESFRASKVMQERIFNNPKIEVVWNSEVLEVMGEKRAEGIKLKIKNLKLKIIDVDGLFVAIGHKPDTELFSNQLATDEKGYIITSERLAIEMAKLKIKSEELRITIQKEKIEEIENRFNFEFKSGTSVNGVFAAGDCVDFQYRQAATAAGMGVATALEVERWLGEMPVETNVYEIEKKL